jgi:EAL domain-containing protein (putative c-di-GMP-specific phosphodiesterase class I)
MTFPFSLVPPPATPLSGLTAEDHLHDSLRRLAGCGSGFYAVHLHLARAAGSVHGLERVRLALQPLELLASLYDARLFCLSDGHVVLVCNSAVPVDQVDVAISKVRSGFLEGAGNWTWDCTWEGKESPDADWYDLAQAEDLARLLSLTAAWSAKPSRAVSPAGAPEAPAVRSLNAEDLGAICQRVEQADLAAVVRQQTALDIRPDAGTVPLFRETYVSMRNLRALVAPGIDMFANGWLFRYLTEILDRRMLEFVASQALGSGPVPISLNLNIASLDTPGFKRFLDVHNAASSKPIIEIQLVDLLANGALFAKIRQSLQAQGHKILIDGLTPLTLQVIDVSRLRSDLVKIWWRQDAPTLFPARRVSGLREVIDRLGRERVILARAESQQALEWGVEHGICRFQGRLVDRLLGALAGRSACDPKFEGSVGDVRAARP